MLESGRPRATTYAGLFLVTLATLMHEILLTRIFSVALSYHFAFMAISVAMFGMTAGAILVYLRPRSFTEDSAPADLARNALFYAVSLVVSTVVFLKLPIDPSPDLETRKLLSWGASYLLIAVPFVFSGLVVAVALTKFPAALNRLYAADLVGAGLGCVLFVVVLPVTGGATAVIVVATLAAAGAVLFTLDVPGLRFRVVAGSVCAALAAFSVVHGGLERENRPLIEITDAMKNPVSVYRYLRWNSHSRVGVAGDPDMPGPAPGWGLSEKTDARNVAARAMVVTIDTFAATPITGFDGDKEQHAYLKDDVTNMAHHIRQNADVAIVGVGGGRDVLSALVFDQNSVLGVELNANVLRALTQDFDDFAGHLGSQSGVTLVNDEARSYITRTDRRFDILQLSLIDTFAATAAGAFVLSENGLYTADAWTTFLGHLKPRGVLTVSRWFYPVVPAEALRLASLAREALSRLGVSDARKHVLIVKVPLANGPAGALGSGVANIMVSPDPFSSEDLAIIGRECERLGFEVIISPEESHEPEFEKVLWSADPKPFFAAYPLDLSAPTDDRPFFFHMLRFRDVGNSLAANFLDPNHGQLKAVRLLAILLVVVFVLTLGCLVVPLAVTTSRTSLRGNGSLLVYFFAIGSGFMFIEMASMQRLMVLLGHPTYALSVVLFTLLIGTGIGSYASPRFVGPGRFSPKVVLLVLVATVAVFGTAMPFVAHALGSASTPVRVAAAAATLFPMGLLLGVPFPLGMRVAAGRAPMLMPWLWGLNGAASVLCSVVAAATSLSLGITATCWFGVLFYVLALVSLPKTQSPAAAAG
jgi:hypothetical protein